MRLEQFIEQDFQQFETALKQSTDRISETRLKESIQYSLMNGGKRVRPLLLLATLRAVNSPLEKGFNSALALEYIHTYSLIHDDLPAMDNDDYRRGQLTNHKKFDEATAILAGDGLLTLAFAVLTEMDDKVLALDLIQILSDCAGVNGMIGGQMADILAEQQRVDLNELVSIHERKTGRLLWFAVYAALKIASVDEIVMNELLTFAEAFGLAFQIHNDIKDEVQDQKRDKSTYVSLLGKEKAVALLQREVERARQAVEEAKQQFAALDSTLLLDFLNYLAL